jgi:hypothetical protein
VKTIPRLILTSLFLFSLSYSQKSEDFKFEDLKIGMTLGHFKKAHPDAEEFPAKDIEHEIGVYQYLAVMKTAAAAACSFLDDTLYSIGIFYNEERLGSETSFENKKEETKENGIKQEITWEFKTRTFVLTSYYNEKTPITFVFRNSMKYDSINKRRESKANLGF